MKYRIVKNEIPKNPKEKWAVRDNTTHEVKYTSNLKKDCQAWIDIVNSTLSQENKAPDPENKQVELIGVKIKEVRAMTKKELDSEGWDDHHPCQVIVLENGVKLYPSADYEGNGTGALFGDHRGNKFAI